MWTLKGIFGQAMNRMTRGDDMNDFHVFEPDGRYLGVVEVPARLQVFRIGADFVLGMVRDDLGVQYIHRYRIEK